jgi:hypothetical protein
MIFMKPTKPTSTTTTVLEDELEEDLVSSSEDELLEDDGPFVVSDEEAAELLEAEASIKRGEYISADELIAELKRTRI